ncbi:AI-2E family transporter [Bacillus halotolerans]|uniref:AI-2E family transporter n=1 Tax=Bacillus halotolerans TaxID=260554 RepID=UPI0038558ED7
MAALVKFFQHPGVRRFSIFVVLTGVLYLFKSMINLILLTFIFTFLMDRLELVVRQFLSRFFRVSQRVVITFLYILLAVLLTVGGFVFYPVVAAQIQQLIKQIKHIAYHPSSIPFFDEITSVFGDINISVFYNEIAFFGGKFARTFGKVLEAQFIIALVNCILTFIALWIMHFPQLLGLSIMVFFLGLIPVAGVVISLIPLSIIAYSTGGGMYVLYIVLVIFAIHAIETYFLNPKLMSAKTELPIFFTFTVLIFSEHFLGIWGLIIGIPIFVFLLDILDVTNKENRPKRPREKSNKK